MVNWFHKFLNPHCTACRAELEFEMTCESCEILKMEIARLRDENSRLLDRILEKPSIAPPISSEGLKPIMPRNIPFRVRQQMLEAEDREKAQAIRRAQTITEVNPNTSQSIEEIEKELGVTNAS